MLERQIMFEQLQELQRQKKVQESNDVRQQNVVNQQSFMQKNQCSGAQYGVINYGIPVRDPSEMFKFGNKNLVHGISWSRCSPFQGKFHESSSLFKPVFSQGQGFNKVEEGKMENVRGNQDLASLNPKILCDSEDNNGGNSVEKHDSLGTKSIKNKSPLFSVKNEDGQQLSKQVNSSTRQPNKSVDVPVQQNFSTSIKGNMRMETAFEASKHVKGGNPKTNVASGLAGQGSGVMHHHDNRVSYIDFKSFGRGSKQKDATPRSHPMNYDPNVRASVKNKKIKYHDNKIPKVTFSPHVVTLNKPTSKTKQLLSLDEVSNQNAVPSKSKKRKFPTFECLPWHKEVTGSCSNLHDISIAELEWSHSVNRLPEKLKEVAEEVAKDSLPMVPRKRRLIITTQLVQLLFPPAPPVILLNDATEVCDIVTYYAAKLALGDACSLATHSHTSTSAKSMTSKSSGDHDLSKTVEGFIDRLKKQEEMLSRLEKGELSILDVKLELQDLEKFSLTNHFAKLNSRGPLVTAGTELSGGASTMQKQYPRRYVEVRPMPCTVPEGHKCLSL